jgi:IPT/TIG domain
MSVRRGRPAPIAMLALAASFLVFVGYGAAAPRSIAAAKAGSPRHGKIGGIVPPRPQSGLAPVGPLGSGNLTYHGGPVMHANTTYAIFWVPSGYSIGDSYQSTIDQFFTDVAADSGKLSNVYATDTQYSDGSGHIAYTSTFAGSVVDTTDFPGSGCFEFETSICLSDDQLQTEIQSVVEAHGWPENGHTVYFLFTPPDVGSCVSDLFGTSCAYEDYCAYHSSFFTSGGEIVYANQPWTSGLASCDVGEYPNGSDADPTLNVVSHEHNEAITDFDLDAWYDAAGFENGDKCAWTFGTLSGSTGAQYNQTINGHHYFLQEEWSNSGSLCRQAMPDTSPHITGFIPSSGPEGTKVTISGTNLNGASAVKFHGTSASFTVNSAIQITATVPTGATTGPISVTTAGGVATSATDFTVTLAPPTVSGFSPAAAAVGTTVTINGTHLGGASSVTFGGISTVPSTIVSASQIKAVVPADAQTGQIGVTTPGGTAFSAGTFKVLPKLTSFTPGSGAAGDSVTIAGSGFTGVSAVNFNGAASSFSVDSDHQITATVPAAGTTGKLSVVTPGGTATSATNLLVVPTITGFAPGSAAAGSTVTVDGTGFGTVTSVKVNGVAASFTRLSALQVRLTVPAAASTGTISVTTAGGTATSAATLAVLPKVTGFTPSAAAVGATVTINGNAFGGASSVLFNGVIAVPATVTATKVTVVVPPAASTGKLTVVTGAGSGQSTGTFKVLPKLTSFTPGSGAAGDSVTIAGSGFTDVTAVKFNGVAAAGYTVDSDHQITATVPASGTIGKLSVVTAGGTATSLTNFVVVPTITGFGPGSAPAGSPVVVDGTGFGTVTSVKVNGVTAAFTRLSAVQLRLTVPASATSGTITATTAGGTATSAGTLSVLPRVTGFTPSAAAVGMTVTITGNAFGGASSVLFNGVGAVPATVLATKITVPVPADASTGKLTVVTGAGPGQSAGTFKVLPKLTSFSPGSGVVGTSITITGTGFTDVTAVKFNGHAASSYTRDSSTQITAMVPLGATTGKISVTTAGGTTTSATSFTVVP